MSDLVQKASDYIFQLYKNELPGNYLYHDYSHTQFVVSNTEELTAHYNINGQEKENLILAALFHDIGHIKSYENFYQKMT